MVQVDNSTRLYVGMGAAFVLQLCTIFFIVSSNSATHAEVLEPFHVHPGLISVM